MRWTILTSSSSPSSSSYSSSHALLLQHLPSPSSLLANLFLLSPPVLYPHAHLSLHPRSFSLPRILSGSTELLCHSSFSLFRSLARSFPCPSSSLFLALDTLYTFLKAFARSQKQSVRANFDRADTAMEDAPTSRIPRSQGPVVPRKVPSFFSDCEKCVKHCKQFDPT